VAQTGEFPRVIVMHRGRVVEDGAPAALAAQPASRYRAMLESEHAARQRVWSAATWRRVRLRAGNVDHSAHTVID